VIQLADNAMLMAMARKEKFVDGYLIKEVGEEFTGAAA
jgi:hypothetical protein